MLLVDTFCGIGGFSLAAHTAGIETLLFCDSRDHSPYVWQVIPRHFPDVPLHDDVRTLTREVVDDALANAASVQRLSRPEVTEQLPEREGDWRELRYAHGSGEARKMGGSDALADASRHESERKRECGIVAGTSRTAEGYSGAVVRDTARSGGEDGTGAGDVVLTEPIILSAGFPCQDISYAGKGAGLEGDRSGLFYEVARLAGELEPEWIVLENVAALLTRGLDAVLGTLASLGYDAWWCCIPACAVGAPHRRDRVWIVATKHDSEARFRAIHEYVLSHLTPFGDLGDGWPTATSRDWKDGGYCENVPTNSLLGRAVWPTPHTNCHTGVGTSGRDGGENPQTATGGSLNPSWVETIMGYPIGYTLPEGEAMRDLPTRWPAGLGAPQHPWEPPRLTTERRHRADRLKALGNSIVPQVAALIFQAIALADAGASSCKEQA